MTNDQLHTARGLNGASDQETRRPTTPLTFTSLTGTIRFRDAASTNQPRRFYRGRESN
jgi:hypothetical protein